MRVSDKCKKHYVAHLTLISVDFRAYPSARLLICHPPNCLFSYISLCPHLPPSSPFNSLPRLSSSLPASPPLCECCCFALLCGYERRSPQGIGGEDVSQGAVWCSAFCGPACPRRADRQLHALGGTNRGTGPLVYLKHEFSHPQNTWPFRLCTDLFRIILQSKEEKG